MLQGLVLKTERNNMKDGKSNFLKVIPSYSGWSQSVQLPHSRKLVFHGAKKLFWAFFWGTVNSVDIIAATDHYLTELVWFPPCLGYWPILRWENHLSCWQTSISYQLSSIQHSRGLSNLPVQRRPSELYPTAHHELERAFMRLSDINLILGIFISLIPWKMPASCLCGRPLMALLHRSHRESYSEIIFKMDKFNCIRLCVEKCAQKYCDSNIIWFP